MIKKRKNNGIFYGIISLVAILAVGSVVVGYSGGEPKVIVEGDYIEAPQEKNLGGVSPNKYNRQFFKAGFQSGGDTYATSSTASNYTLTNTELGGDISYIEWNAGSNITITTMASSSPIFDAILGYNPGDKRVYDVYSATTTTATTITWEAGTGVDLQEDEGGTVVQNGLEFARITFIRKANTDIGMIVEVFQVGD